MSLHVSPELELPLDAADIAFGRVGQLSSLRVGVLVLRQEELHWAVERLLRLTTARRDCWEWTGYTRNGYPSISIRNRDVYGHRLALAIATGADQPQMDARHSCDFTRCWRFEHLSWGSRQDNVRDAYERGRAVPPPRLTGLDCHLTTLSEATLDEIAAAAGSQRAVAARFGVSQSTVWRARHGLARR